MAILQENILPRIQEFKPELVIFLNGVDGHVNDPVTSKYPKRPFELTNENYKQLASIMANFAGNTCGGKIVGEKG